MDSNVWISLNQVSNFCPKESEAVFILKYETYQNTPFPIPDWHNVTIEYEGWNFNSGNYLFTTDTK